MIMAHIIKRKLPYSVLQKFKVHPNKYTVSGHHQSASETMAFRWLPTVVAFGYLLVGGGLNANSQNSCHARLRFERMSEWVV